MPDFLASYTAADLVTIALAGVMAVLLAAMGYRAWRHSRITPEERERLRCAWLTASGKMGDATLVEIRLLFYSYAVRGVEYTASQDTRLLGPQVPADLSTLAAVCVKYDSRNPANSIVLARPARTGS